MLVGITWSIIIIIKKRFLAFKDKLHWPPLTLGDTTHNTPWLVMPTLTPYKGIQCHVYRGVDCHILQTIRVSSVISPKP